MQTELLVPLVLAVMVIGSLVTRWIVRRFRRLRRLDRAQAGVVEAMADGRLASTTGQALLQHLDGLRRTCSWEREG